MRAAEWINLTFFLFAIVASLRLKLGQAQRLGALGIGAVGIALIVALQGLRSWLPPGAVSLVRDWLPVPMMILAYRQGGMLFTEPRKGVQDLLERFDRLWFKSGARVRPSGGHYWMAEFLELSYMSCYAVVPAGLGVLYLAGAAASAATFWAVVLPPTYLCYGLVAFFPTLPPRTLLPAPKAGQKTGLLRVLNLWILKYGSIQVNNFPSPHVAASVAVSLALLHLGLAAGWIFMVVALCIALGAVWGRYHYAADALLAAALAVVTFGLETHSLF